MEYLGLTYIDDFTVQMIMISFIMFLVFMLVFYFSKSFSWFLNEIFDLKKSDNNIKYDNFFQD